LQSQVVAVELLLGQMLTAHRVAVAERARVPQL
jgi:hypothetical protein